jgi:hypothetical protein
MGNGRDVMYVCMCVRKSSTVSILPVDRITTDWRSGLSNAYCAKGREFDPRTVATFVCMNMSVCIGSECFLCVLWYVFTKKKGYKYVYLSSIHNTSLMCLLWTR